MKTRKEDIWALIESARGQEDLGKLARDSMMGWNRPLCTQIVAYAHAPLEVKIRIFDLLEKYTAEVPEEDDLLWANCPGDLANKARLALSERYTGPPGMVFSAESSFHGGFDLYRSYDKAVEGLLIKVQELGQDGVGYTGNELKITKWVSNENGDFETTLSWFLNTYGEIMYYSFGTESNLDD